MALGAIKGGIVNSRTVWADKTAAQLTLLALIVGLSAVATNARAAPDTTSPGAAFVSPANRIGVGTTIRISVYDPARTGQDQSEINLKDVELTVGGNNVTLQADYHHEDDRSRTYSIGSFAFTKTKSKFGVVAYKIPRFPTIAHDRPIAVALKMTDVAGNKRTVRKTFRFDSKSGRDSRKPTGVWLSPQTNKVIRSDRTTLRMRVSDAPTGGGRRHSQLNLSSFRLTVGGRDVTADARYYHRGRTSKAYKVGPLAVTTRFLTSDTGLVVYQPTAARPLPWGSVEAVLRFTDHEGNVGLVKRNMNIKDSDSPILSLPRALPAAGNAPLKVRFQPGFDVETAVKRVQWDFDGDGKYDINEEVGRDQAFEYKEPGKYRARLRLTDSRGRIAIGTVNVTVRNAAPSVSATASPSNGQIPLKVSFRATATDIDGIRSYAWDFNGDGKYDYRSTSSGNASYEYRKSGNFRPVVLVIDNRGRSTRVELPTTRVKASRKGFPSVELSASPGSAVAPATVRFSARAQFPDGASATKWSWDFNGDGKYDKDTDTPNTDFKYTAARTYYPKVRVTSSKRRTAEDVVAVDIDATVKLTMSADTILPDQGEFVSVDSTISGSVNIGVNIENENGKVIRQLVKTTRRKAGDYVDKWDGRDNAGKVVKDGVYYAVAKYQIGNRKIRLDLRDSTGGVQGNPQRNRLDSSFQPFAGEPLKVSFTLKKAAKVTAFMGLFNVNSRLLTFYQRKPLGRGEHTIVWNGENANGKLVHPPSGDRFLFGIFEFSLADNAVVVKSTAEVNDVSASPTIFVPGPSSRSKVEFSLTKDADVELVLINAETGVEAGRRKYRNRKVGDNTINWDGKVNVTSSVRSYVTPGRYRLGVRALMSDGSTSIAVYTVQQIYF